jgi:hypothetical protein
MHHVSAYASAHPWEDWAETWAHCLHILDTLETVASFGLSLTPMKSTASVATSPHLGFEAALKTWVPLTCALNSVNRGMGLNDLYPFVLSNGSLKKLRFAHEIIGKNSSASAAETGIPVAFPIPAPESQRAVV